MDPKLEAAFKYVESVSHTADYPIPKTWHGWALREAFVAGMKKAEDDSARARRVGEAVLRSLSDSFMVAAIEAKHLDPAIRSLDAAGYYNAAEAYRAIAEALRGEP